MDVELEQKPWKFITRQPQILYWRNLPQLRTFIRSLYVKNLAVSNRVQEGVDKKPLKMTGKVGF